MFTIINEGQEILSTNYFESENASHGYYFLSINAGCIRLLVPKKMIYDLHDMSKAKKIIITYGKWPEENNRKAFLIKFDDGSELPYISIVTEEQCDRLIKEEKYIVDFSVWTEDGLFKKWSNCEYKKAELI